MISAQLTAMLPQLDPLLDSVGLAGAQDPTNYRVARLTFLVSLDRLMQAAVLIQRRRAVDQFKKMCRDRGLVAVKSIGFDQLINDLDRLPDGDMADHARHLVHDALNPPEQAVLGEPEFTVKENADLDRLLNSTAALLSGHANQDVGMAWYDDLQVVLGKLATTSLPARREPLSTEVRDQAHAAGWNACLDAAEKMRAQPAEEEHNSQDPDCSCPSGNGSLRWPCPVHSSALDDAIADQAHRAVYSDHAYANVLALSAQGKLKIIADLNAVVKVEGFDYPTTYADLAHLPAEKLWNRYVASSGFYPNAKAAFLVARAIPFVCPYVIPPDQAPASSTEESRQ